jgi:hypothetical protein
VLAIFEDGDDESVWLAPGAVLFCSMNLLLILTALNFFGGTVELLITVVLAAKKFRHV